MIQLVHIFDFKSRDDDESFINWLDANLYGKAKEFGCEDRKTWVFLDGVKNPYSRLHRPLRFACLWITLAKAWKRDSCRIAFIQFAPITAALR